MAWRARLNVQISKMEIMLQQKLQENGISHRTQVEIPVTIADFYLPTEPRPTLVFLDGPPHRSVNQSMKDEEVRVLLRKKGYRVLELSYTHYSDKVLDEMFREILSAIGSGSA